MADKKFLGKLGSNKTLMLLILGVLGIALVIIGGINESDNKNSKLPETILTNEAYINELENKICNIVAKVTQDTSAGVIVVCDGGTEHIYTANEDEGGKEYVTIKNENGYSLVPYRDIYPKIIGISIACRGGDNPETVQKLLVLISTAFDISTNRICIVGTK